MGTERFIDRPDGQEDEKCWSWKWQVDRTSGGSTRRSSLSSARRRTRARRSLSWSGRQSAFLATLGVQVTGPVTRFTTFFRGVLAEQRVVLQHVALPEQRTEAVARMLYRNHGGPCKRSMATCNWPRRFDFRAVVLCLGGQRGQRVRATRALAIVRNLPLREPSVLTVKGASAHSSDQRRRQRADLPHAQ